MKMRRSGLVVSLGLVLGACSGGGSKPPADGGVAPTRDFGVTVNDAKARACDVLLVEGTRQVAGVTFASTVKGQWNRWDPRVGLAFTALEDKALGDVATLKLRIVKDEAQFPSVTVTCYDRTGAKLAGSKVTIK
jgi:hypothetical protein